MNDRPRIEKLRRDQHVDRFDCGQQALNRFLVRYAFQNQQSEASQTYVALVADDVVGFYTLVVAQVEYDDAPQRLGRGTRPISNPAGAARSSGGRLELAGQRARSGASQRRHAADAPGCRHRRHPSDRRPRQRRRRARLLRAVWFRGGSNRPVHLFVLLKDVRMILKQQ
jgi:hypothetical protein